MITHYLKVAIRNLLKYKTQNLISIVGLAVGLFCFCLCFYISRFTASVDRCFENHERIAEIILTIPEEGRDISGVSGKLVSDLRQREWTASEGFTFVSYPQSKVFTINSANEEMLPYNLTLMETDSLYKRIFTPKLITGSWEQASHTRNAITLDTERRQKEVAIRKVNGAGLKEIILLFARLYIWVLGISAAIALPIVYLIIQQWKQMYLVFFNDGILYWGGILLGVTSITALTVIFRILKVARINPAEIIKSE